MPTRRTSVVPLRSEPLADALPERAEDFAAYPWCSEEMWERGGALPSSGFRTLGTNRG